MNVTLFEDNDSLREILSQLINDSEDMTCGGAFPDTFGLLDRIDETNPDVVIMDIDLPGMNGIAAVEALKEHRPELPVLILTVFEDDDKIFHAVCAGAAGYLLKNTPPNRLLEALRELKSGGAPMSSMVARKVLAMFKDRSTGRSQASFNLTERELEVLDLITKGISYKAISEKLEVSLDTIKFHAKNIYDKLQVHTKTDAVVKALKHRIV